MKIEDTNIEGLYLIKVNPYNDERGCFYKIFHEELFIKNNLNIEWAEEYFSISKKNVIRGLHFQMPPYDHEKVVCCIKGKVLDVVLDLRKSSPTFGKVASFILNEENKCQLYIPRGCAHGFKSLKNDSMMFYKVSTIYNEKFDTGLLWSSIPFDWGLVNPILSERDKNLPSFLIEKDYFI